jgi:hypothetical protein
MIAFLCFLVLIACFGKQNLINVTADTSLDAFIDYKDGSAKEGITDIGVWRVGQQEDDRLFYLTKKVPADKENPFEGVALRIYDNGRKLIYEERANGYGDIEVMNMLRQTKPQLVIKSINYGGSESDK